MGRPGQAAFGLASAYYPAEFDRRCLVLPLHCPSRVLVHNGRTLASIRVDADRVGYSFGNYLATRRSKPKPHLDPVSDRGHRWRRRQ